VNLEDAMRRKSGQLELPLDGRGEAPRAERSGEASTAVHGNERSGSDEAHLMERVVERGNVIAALKRVQKNKGSPGIDGMTVEALRDHLRETWPVLRKQLLAGTYRPQPVKRQLIPKSDGGERELGIPTALDRFIQQALLQVVDVDLEKFFDRVNHDVLMGKLAKRVTDKRVLGLIRRYLDAGIMERVCWLHEPGGRRASGAGRVAPERAPRLPDWAGQGQSQEARRRADRSLAASSHRPARAARRAVRRRPSAA
jgi:hypothetical protein